MRNNLIVRKNIRNNKNALVESIMTKVAPIVKKALKEGILNDELPEEEILNASKTNSKDYVIEENILINGEDTEYTVKCFDGFAIAEKTKGNGQQTLYLTYPSMEVANRFPEMIDKAMVYRFGDVWREHELVCCYGDLMMSYGKVIPQIILHQIK